MRHVLLGKGLPSVSIEAIIALNDKWCVEGPYMMYRSKTRAPLQCLLIAKRSHELMGSTLDNVQGVFPFSGGDLNS